MVFGMSRGVAGKTEFHGARFGSRTDLEIDVYLKSYFSGKYRIWQGCYTGHKLFSSFRFAKTSVF